MCPLVGEGVALNFSADFSQFKNTRWGENSALIARSSGQFKWFSPLFFGFFVLLVALLRQPGGQRLDATLSAHFVGFGGAGVTQCARFLALAGSKGLYLAIPLLLLWVWRAGRWRALRNFGLILLGHCVLLSTKSWVARPRPDSLSPFSHLDSFPSGHTLIAVILAGSIALFLAPCDARKQPAFGILVWLWPFLMGLSRIQMGRHFIGDVVGAWLLGAGWLCLCAAFVRPISQNSGEVRP